MMDVNMEIELCTISEDEIISALETETTLTLATCTENRVTIRPMSHINVGMDIYFQTGAESLKIQQIKKNHNVALCVGTYQIEGEAQVLGHPLDEDNVFFAQAYKAKHPGSFELYSTYADEVVVRVTIRRVTQWKYSEGKPVIAELICENSV